MAAAFGIIRISVNIGILSVVCVGWRIKSRVQCDTNASVYTNGRIEYTVQVPECDSSLWLLVHVK